MEENLEPKRFNISCCRSYLTPKGRCYTCPEMDETEDNLGVDSETEEVTLEKDPDIEEY